MSGGAKGAGFLEVERGAEAIGAAGLPDGAVEFVVVGEVGEVELNRGVVAAEFVAVAHVEVVQVVRRNEAAIDRDGARGGRDADEFGFAFAEVFGGEHQPGVFQQTLVELVAHEGGAGVFGDVGGGFAEVAARTAAGGDEVLLGEEAQRVGIGGGREGRDLFDLNVVLGDAEIKAQIAQRDIVHLQVEALGIGGGFNEGAEAGAVDRAGGGDEEILNGRAEVHGAVFVAHGESGKVDEQLALEEVETDAGFGVFHGGTVEGHAVAVVGGVSGAGVHGTHRVGVETNPVHG